MKMFKKLTQNQLIGLVTAVFVVVLGVVLLTTKEAPTEEVSFDPEVAPPTLTIDTSYNATLSGEPFYIVTEDDEDMYDDSLDTCDEIGSDSDRIELQNRWYQVVAYEDDMTVEEVIFSQIELREGDKMIAVTYDAENQEFKAMPNKLILNTDGNNVEILEFDETLKRGTVIAVSANRDADFCADYDEVGLHENIENKWNLVSRPDFETVDYRAIWEVAFAKGGDSGVDPERYYSYTDPDDSVEVADLSTDLLYWVYGGEPGTVTDGGDLPEENNGGNNGDDEQGFVVEVNNSVTNPGQAGVRDVVSGETFEIDEEGTLGFAVGLKETPEEDVEMNFVLRVDGVVVTNGMNDVAKITSPGVDPANGRNFVADQSAEVLSYSLVSLDDLNDVSETVTVTVSDVAGELDPVTFNVKINDDEATDSSGGVDDSDDAVAMQRGNYVVNFNEGIGTMLVNFRAADDSELESYSDSYWSDKFEISKRGSTVDLSDGISFARVNGQNALRVTVDLEDLSEVSGTYDWRFYNNPKNTDGADLGFEGSFQVAESNYVCENRLLKVRVVDTAGEKMEGVNLLVRKSGRIAAGGSTDSEGLADIVLVDGDGSYNVIVSEEGYVEDSMIINYSERQCSESAQFEMLRDAVTLQDGGPEVPLSGPTHTVYLERPAGANVVVQSDYQPSDRSLTYNIRKEGDNFVMDIMDAQRANFTLQVQYAETEPQSDNFEAVNAVYRFEITE